MHDAFLYLQSFVYLTQRSAPGCSTIQAFGSFRRFWAFLRVPRRRERAFRLCLQTIDFKLSSPCWHRWAKNILFFLQTVGVLCWGSLRKRDWPQFPASSLCLFFLRVLWSLCPVRENHEPHDASRSDGAARQVDALGAGSVQQEIADREHVLTFGWAVGRAGHLRSVPGGRLNSQECQRPVERSGDI